MLLQFSQRRIHLNKLCCDLDVGRVGEATELDCEATDSTYLCGCVCGNDLEGGYTVLLGQVHREQFCLKFFIVCG